MTVFIYVVRSKQVGDKDHLKVFASEDAAETWLQGHEERAPIEIRQSGLHVGGDPDLQRPMRWCFSSTKVCGNCSASCVSVALIWSLS